MDMQFTSVVRPFPFLQTSRPKMGYEIINQHMTFDFLKKKKNERFISLVFYIIELLAEDTSKVKLSHLHYIGKSKSLILNCSIHKILRISKLNTESSLHSLECINQVFRAYQKLSPSSRT